MNSQNIASQGNDGPDGGNNPVNEKQTGKRGYKKRKNTSPHWEHFEQVTDANRLRQGKCKYCKTLICADSERNGTSPLGKHLNRCRMFPDNLKNQTSMFTKQNDDGQSSLKTWKYDPANVRKSLIRMIIEDELSFSFVERKGSREFIEAVCPSVKIPSRFTVARDIVDYYLEEKKNWNFHKRIIIDDSWNFHKRIISFKPILSHKGDHIASAIQECLYEWGIEHVMIFTMDNASSNDVAVRELSIRLPNLLGNGKYLHVRCLAHIMNLIVQDGLKAQDRTIECVRNAVKYVRQTPARIVTFKACVQERKIESKGLLSLDVCTRWNSTCEMLEKAVLFEKAFDSFALKEPSFRKDLVEVPDSVSWKYANRIISLLQLFKQKTEDVSCSTYAVAHEFYPQVMDIAHNLEEMHTQDTNLFEFKKMISLMKVKFEKYFEDAGKMNKLFEFANILDPRLKLELIEFGCRKTVDFIKLTGEEMNDEEYAEMVEKMVDDVKSEMQLLVTEYENLYQTGSSHPVRKESVGLQSFGNNAWMAKFEKFKTVGVQPFGKKTKLERYLKDDIEKKTNNFDILQWWKANSARYPTLSKMAKDILAIPVSTVASESAFSTGGRVVESHRSSLSPQIVEALIWSQDWIRMNRKESNETDDFEKFDELPKDVFDKIELMRFE